MLVLDPLAVAKEQAEAKVNDTFNGWALASAQRDHEYAAKRRGAELVAAGQDAPAHFAEAAAIEGRSVADFAIAILAKPDDTVRRGLDRRRTILAVRSAESPAAIDAILAGLPH